MKDTLAELSITLKPSVYKMDVRPMLKIVLDAFFGPSASLVDLIVDLVPSPLMSSAAKVSIPLTDLAGPRSGSDDIDIFRYNTPTPVQ